MKGFVIAGTSAGANLAVVASHLYVQEKAFPPLTGVYLSILNAAEPEAVPERYKAVYLSRDQIQEAPVLNRVSMEFFGSMPIASLLNSIFWLC